MTNPTPTWTETRLWKLLSERSDDQSKSIASKLRPAMVDIERVLTSGGTAPPEFTLHDTGHSFRVAQRMVELMPSSVPEGLSADELALLLLAAYTHDIGMTPEFGRVQRIRQYLLDGEAELVDDDLRQSLQEWLDDHESGIEPPLSQPSGSTAEATATANVLTAHFCRAQHVDWSEEWVRKHLCEPIGSYPRFVDDLARVIRSHHQTYRELERDDFATHILGDGPQVVNLRYLAVVLRVADVLEFDPERTPDVIFRHRSISEASEIYWHKDHHIRLVQDGDRLVLEGRPPNAKIEQAIRLTAEQVESELQLARRIADQFHFQTVPGLDQETSHKWSLAGTLHLKISADDSYEFIDGTFRPDTGRLLELLTGQELYREPLAALRELLQNAFDAVKDQIAWERLELSNPMDDAAVGAIVGTHRVDLRLETTSEGLWLICRDTGTGMTRAIIQDRLLVSGSGPRHDVLDLERRSAKAGFSTGRTGAWGIGVLSYFMLADRIEISTRRSPEPGDSEANGWHFSTDGIDAFGELRKDGDLVRGTEVRLHIRSDVASSPEDFFEEILSYLSTTVAHVPCALRVHSGLPERTELVTKPGWTLTDERLWSLVRRDFAQRRDMFQREDNVPLEQLSVDRQRILQAGMKERRELEEEVRGRLEWRHAEGTLPEGLGDYRLHIPVFTLESGNSLVFLRPTRRGSRSVLAPVGTGLAYFPTQHFLMSWKGMAVGMAHREGNTVIIGFEAQTLPQHVVSEVNWTNSRAGSISVDRRTVDISDAARKALSWLRQESLELVNDTLADLRNSPYEWLSYRHANTPPPPSVACRWAYPSRGKTLNSNVADAELEWGEITSPAVPSLAFIYEGEIGPYTWRRRKVHIIPSVPGVGEDDHYDGLSWHFPRSAPDRLLWRPHYRPKVVPLWTDKPGRRGNTHAVGLTADFPPDWTTTLCAVKFHHYNSPYLSSIIWNPAHPVVSAIDADAGAWASEAFSESLDPLPHRSELVAQRPRAAAWVLRCLAGRAWEIWEGLEDREPGFLTEITEILGSSETSGSDQIRFAMLHETTDGYIDVPGVRSWRVLRLHRDQDEVARMLSVPKPALEWHLQPAR